MAAIDHDLHPNDTILRGCPHPIPDPRHPKWKDVGGKKFHDGLQRRWLEFIDWHVGSGASPGIYPEAFFFFKEECHITRLQEFAYRFAGVPIKHGEPMLPMPGDRILRKLSDLGEVVQEQIEKLQYNPDGTPDIDAFVDELRNGNYPVHRDDVEEATANLTKRLAHSLAQLAGQPKHQGGYIGAALRLAVTNPPEEEEESEQSYAGLSPQRFLASYLGQVGGRTDKWDVELEQQLRWVESVVEQATTVLGTLIDQKRRVIRQNKMELEGSAKERLYELKRAAARQQTRPMFAPGWGTAELKEQKAKTGPRYDHQTEQELSAQMEEVRRKTSEVMWSSVRNVAHAAITTSHTPRAGVKVDMDEEERLDKALKDMFEHDMTRMLLLYRLPPEHVVRHSRPEWGRIVRNAPELPNEGTRKKGRGGRLNALTPPVGGPPPHPSAVPAGSTAAGQATAAMEQLDQEWVGRKSELNESRKLIEASDADLGKFKVVHKGEMDAIQMRQQEAGKGYRPPRGRRRGGGNGSLSASASEPSLRR